MLAVCSTCLQTRGALHEIRSPNSFKLCTIIALSCRADKQIWLAGEGWDLAKMCSSSAKGLHYKALPPCNILQLAIVCNAVNTVCYAVVKPLLGSRVSCLKAGNHHAD